MTRWKLTIEYDGRAYAGWQRQDNVPSIQQTLEEAITAFCQQEIRLHVAGRTDAGVHALGQVAHFDLDYGTRPLNGFSLCKALNAHLPDAGVAVLGAVEVDDDFHARYGAVSKLYTYRIVNRQAPLTLERGQAWHIRRPLDTVAMQAAADHLIGHHDFSTFRAAECQAKSPLRTLDRLEIKTSGDDVLIYAEARSFLHHQVRNMTGTLARVGEGKWTPDDVKAALAARDRRRGCMTAPPDGLYLVAVRY